MVLFGILAKLARQSDLDRGSHFQYRLGRDLPEVPSDSAASASPAT
jgi:hypothetical protein